MINKISTLLASTAIATGTVATLAAAPAHALNSGICLLTDVKYNGASGAVNATDCRGELEIGTTDWNFNNDVLGNGNPLLSQLNNVFGLSPTEYQWSFVGKDETSGANTPANGFNGYSDAKTGNWSFTEGLNGPFAISVKASTGFSVYLFDNITAAIENVTSGSWSTASLRTDNGGGNQPNLSHISLFRASYVPPEPPTPRPVPEPASLVGLGLLASGMVISRRRRTFC